MARQQVADLPRPVNNIQIYGGERHGDSMEEGFAKFWRNIIGGISSARFHRPGPVRGYYGAGLGPQAQIHLNSARIFTDAFDNFRAEPAMELLHNREVNEAYITAVPGEQYAIYFTDGGEIVFSKGVGIDDDEVRTGNAMIIDPYGEIITETWKAEEDMVVADLDPRNLHKCTDQRWLTSRRPELYGPPTEFTGREKKIRESRFDTT